MRSITRFVLGTVAALIFCVPAVAQCVKVRAKSTEIVITPFGSPNDPLGRTVFDAQGGLFEGTAVGTAILTSVGPGPTPGTLGATSRHVFVVTEQDQLTATGVLVFTPIAGTPNVTSSLTLTVTGGTGKFASATGTLVGTGTGFNFFPLPPGPSSANNSSFQYTFTGELCGVPSSEDNDTKGGH
jgi:hypothetical protein